MEPSRDRSTCQYEPLEHVWNIRYSFDKMILTIGPK